MSYPKLFSSLKIKGFELRNRIVHLPTVTRFCENNDGLVNQRHLEFYGGIAKGGVGMTIVESLGIVNKPSENYLRISEDYYIDRLKHLADLIHKHGVICSAQPIHFLEIYPNGHRQEPHDLDRDEITKLRDLYIKAAIRMKKAGFDGVDLHCAHSTSLSSFLSPRANKRTDEYGGSAENRARIVKEILEGTRQLVGDSFILGVRINAEDFIAGGNTLLHTRIIAKKLEEWGIDYLNISVGGRYEDGKGYRGYSGRRAIPTAEMPDGVNVYLAEDLKKQVNIPVITAGKIPTPELAETILQENKADLIGLCRPLIRDPQWANKAKTGREMEIDKCVYCNNCLDKCRMGIPIDCVKWETYQPHKGKVEDSFHLKKVGFNYQLEKIENTQTE